MVNCWVYDRHIALVDGIYKSTYDWGGRLVKQNPELGMKYIVPCLCISIKKQLNNFADFYAFRNTTEVFQ